MAQRSKETPDESFFKTCVKNEKKLWNVLSEGLYKTNQHRQPKQTQFSSKTCVKNREKVSNILSEGKFRTMQRSAERPDSNFFKRARSKSKKFPEYIK